MSVDRSTASAVLHNIATQLRIDSVVATTEAGSGHPSSCCSAAEIVATLFFSEMRFDPKRPQHPENDRFVLSKGHAAPLLYAAWAEAGAFPRSELLRLRSIDSDLEGHPTPRLNFVDVATGSLGQGICAGVGLALNARRIGSDYRTYVLLGDGESAEGSVWEAANAGAFHRLDNFCGITDVNGLGQSQPAAWDHHLEEFERRWRACGWHTITVDGHDLEALAAAYAEARTTKGRPTMIVARTVKGRGIAIMEGKEGWHGKALKKGEEADRALAELRAQLIETTEEPPPIPAPSREGAEPEPVDVVAMAPVPAYKLGDQVATREAYGAALVTIGRLDPRVVALDADVKNSTFSEPFAKAFPERFYQCFIAEQVMVGAAMGLAARGAIPFPSTFACFLTRAADFIRMAGISAVNVKLAGSHAGVSIGEDGPSQMGLEDLALMRAVPGAVVLYPCDAMSTERLMALAAAHRGLVYVRTSRPKTAVLYDGGERFTIGGAKVLRRHPEDAVTVVAAGVTVHEALAAYDTLQPEGLHIRVIDAYSVQPIDKATLVTAARDTHGRVITVEDHYPAGGLGDAVSEAVATEGFAVRRLAVREIPRSGKGDELMDRYGISARAIVEAVRALAGREGSPPASAPQQIRLKPDPTSPRASVPDMIHRVRSLFDVRPGEARPLFLAFLYIALVVASFLLAKPIRIGLFLNQYSAHSVVYVYVAVPLALTVFVPLYTRVTARVGQRTMITGTLLFFCANVVAFWYLFRWKPFPALSGVFYVWVNCFGIIAPVQGWTFANSIFDTRQAKRLFPLIASGASFGAISGGLLARYLVRPVGGTANLLLVLAGLILAAAVVMNLTRLVIPRRKPAASSGKRSEVFGETLALMGRTRYLTLIAATVFLVAIVTQWTQFQLLLVAREEFLADADRLTRFYGAFNFYMGVTALLIQLLITSTALRRFGITITILALPLALGFGNLLILFVPTFLSVLLTNGLDQGLRFSIDKATYELLFLPLPSEIKNNVKVTIDTVINRLADGVGGLALGLATNGFLGLPGAGLQMRGLALVTVVLTGVWIAVVSALRRGYVEVIRDSIHQHRLDAERTSSTLLERTTADQVLARLGASDAKEILYALRLFEAHHRHVTHPALRALLGHPAAEVRRKALALLRESGDRSVRADVERLLTDLDLETRTEALLYLAHHAQVDPLARIEQLGDFPDFSIRASLVAFLARPGSFQNLDAATLLLEQMSTEAGDGGQRARLEAARLLGVLPDAFDGVMRRLLQDPNSEVVRVTMRAASKHGRRDLTDLILSHIVNPELADDAAKALAQLGDEVVEALSQRLYEPSVPAEIRREIPSVLVRIGSPAAQRALVEGLLESDTSLRFRIISSLNKLRLVHPSIVIDTQVVETALAAEIMGHYRSYQILGTLGEALDSEGPVVSALRQSMQQEVERIFRLIGLLIRDADVYSAYLGLESSNRTVRSNALEFLDTILKPQLRALLLPIIEPTVTVAERVRLANQVVGAPVTTREEAVIALLRSDDPWIQSCGAYAIGTLGLHDLEPQLDKWISADDPLLRETARMAKQSLAATPVATEEPPAEEEEEWKPSESMGIG